MIVEKKAIQKDNYYNKLAYYDSARQGLEAILGKLKEEDFILYLPAYIGWSSREGSGIYDPVFSSKIQHVFYALDRQLNIQLADLEELLKKDKRKKAFLLVDYFGFIDKNYNQIIERLKEYEVLIIEDAAHAFFTDYVDHNCGKRTDIVLYSLHKMFPFAKGGMIKINNKYWNKIASFEGKCPINPFEYKLDEIADCRKRNAMAIQKKLSHNPCFTFIRPIDQYLNCTPQSVPIMIKNYDKSNLYFRMNELGYGVVSLYHTMIEPVRKNFPQAIEIGNCMLNLPVHQDIGIDEIGKMCEALEQLCSDNSQSVK